MSRFGGAVLAAVLCVAAGCGTDSKSASKATDASPPSTAAGAIAGPGATPEAGGPGTTVVVTGGRQIAYTAELAVETKDVAGAVARAAAIATANGGLLFDQATDLGEPASGTVTLKVPPDRLAATLDELSGLGKLRSRGQRAEDVTTQVVDIDARIETARASVARLRGFLSQAANVDDLAALEGELTTRETELEQLVAQQRALGGQVALATVTARFTEPVADAVADIPGVGTALRAGLDAFLTAGQVLLVALAWSLPFLGVAALALLIFLAWRSRRSRRRRRAPAQPLPPPGLPGPDSAQA